MIFFVWWRDLRGITAAPGFARVTQVKSPKLKTAPWNCLVLPHMTTNLMTYELLDGLSYFLGGDLNHCRVTAVLRAKVCVCGGGPGVKIGNGIEPKSSPGRGRIWHWYNGTWCFLQFVMILGYGPRIPLNDVRARELGHLLTYWWTICI